MSGFQLIAQPPRFLSQQDAEVAQQSTPGSFASLPPTLRLHLDNVRIYLSPPPPHVSSCFAPYQIPASSRERGNHSDAIEEHGQDDDGQQEEEEEEETQQTVIADGQLWLTDSQLSFLSTPTGSGFSVTYPTISLHAVTRSPPVGLEPPGKGAAASQSNGQSSSTASASSSSGCLYVQLDLSAEDETAEQDDEGSLLEMHVFTADSDSLDQLFDALSHCASLHPSVGGGLAGDGSSNPFGGLAPFGTGSGDTDGMAVDGAFDDADEDGDGVVSDVQATADDDELSEAGRRTLAHLESVMVWPHEAEQGAADQEAKNRAVDEGAASPPSKAGNEPTNTLILRNLPPSFFVPSICSALLSLLNAYGKMARWIPMVSAGRAIVVFEETEGAAMAKNGLDRLVFPFEGDGDKAEGVQRGGDGHKQDDDENDLLLLRAVYGPTLPTVAAEDTTLSVPTTDKNFLISPPGSPPVGWEPIKEDPPNRDTLAEDLMKALGELRDTQRHLTSHQPALLSSGEQGEEGAQTTSGTMVEEVIIPPSSAPALRKHTPAWLLPPGSATGEQTRGKDQETISVPGVTVQSFDPPSATSGEDGQGRTFMGYTISSVKATVESMRSPTLSPASRPSAPGKSDEDVPVLSVGLGGDLGAASGGGRRITPTSRPPLAE